MSAPPSLDDDGVSTGRKITLQTAYMYTHGTIKDFTACMVRYRARQCRAVLPHDGSCMQGLGNVIDQCVNFRQRLCDFRFDVGSFEKPKQH